MGIPFGRYQLLKKIASGGMGQVLLAKKGQDDFEKLVVLKRILPHLVEDEEFFTMFRDEAKITMRLDHPNIARINEFGVEQNVHFIEMEYVAGEDLRRLEKVAAAGQLVVPLGVIIRVIADAAAGLDFAHKAKDSKGVPLGLVHRDVSPQNVLIGFDGSVKLIDFGVAKAMGRAQHTATGILKGKFPYMSPEQADGLELDPRSDVFALGIVLWEQLTGRRLFKGDNDLATQRLVKACVVAPPSSLDSNLPKELDAIVLKALAKLPADRYADAAEFRMALEDYALENSIPASSAHLAAFMQSVYSERIAKEQDPKSLEEDSGLTAMDAGPGPASAGNHGNTANGKAAATPSGGGLKVMPMVILVAVLGLIGGGIWFATRPDPISQVALPQPNTTVAVVAPVNPPPVVPAKVDMLTLALQSEPSGALVEIAGEKKGITPLEVRIEMSKLPMLLNLTAPGYEAYNVTLSETSEPAMTVQMKKKKTGPAAPPIKQER